MLIFKSSGSVLPNAARLSCSCHPPELKNLGQAFCKQPKRLALAKRYRSPLKRLTQISASPARAASMGDVFFLDEFASRQWDDPDYSGTTIEGDKQKFINEVHRQHRQARTSPIFVTLIAIQDAGPTHAAFGQFAMPVFIM